MGEEYIASTFRDPPVTVFVLAICILLLLFFFSSHYFREVLMGCASNRHAGMLTTRGCLPDAGFRKTGEAIV